MNKYLAFAILVTAIFVMNLLVRKQDAERTEKERKRLQAQSIMGSAVGIILGFLLIFIIKNVPIYVDFLSFLLFVSILIYLWLKYYTLKEKKYLSGLVICKIIILILVPLFVLFLIPLIERYLPTYEWILILTVLIIAISAFLFSLYFLFKFSKSFWDRFK